VTHEPASCETQQLEAKRRRERSRLWFTRVLWVASIVALLAALGWICFDPHFSAAVAQLLAVTEVVQGNSSAVEAFDARHGMRLQGLVGIILIAGGTLLGIFLGLFIGVKEHRSTRTWLAFIALVAAWLTLAVGWGEFAWQGQRLRLRSAVNEFDALANSLRDNWPSADGERPGLGSFMAYPQGTPRMLMMLVSETDPQIAAIERADDGALGFEIRGEEPGTWLEWHPAGSVPKTFVGGLEADYEFNRTSPLGRGWYLVRYR
jgi:hypothetical protein